jgi:hypothetical protein
MTLDEARAAVKAQHLQNYTEGVKTLSYIDNTSGPPQQKLLPNGKFVNVVGAANIDTAEHSVGQLAVRTGSAGQGEELLIHFTTVPDHSRVIEIYHEVDLAPSHAILESALIKSLTDKYGGNSFRDPDKLELHWITGAGTRLGASGTSRHGGALPPRCSHLGAWPDSPDFFGFGPREFGSDTSGDPGVFRVSLDMWKDLLACGHAVLTASWAVSNPTAPPDQRLVFAYKVVASTPSLAFKGALVTSQMVHGGANANTEAAAQKAVGNKPSL